MSEKWAKINVLAIGLFLIASGAWEYLLGVSPIETTCNNCYLIGVYGKYLMIIGLSTILLGVTLLFRVNAVRVLVIVLSWWNIFASPILAIWWIIYTTQIKKILGYNPEALLDMPICFSV